MLGFDALVGDLQNGNYGSLVIVMFFAFCVTFVYMIQFMAMYEEEKRKREKQKNDNEAIMNDLEMLGLVRLQTIRVLEQNNSILKAKIERDNVIEVDFINKAG